ncbi:MULTISPECIES: amino acid ABC transporter permease [Bacillaceae]|uniref:Amino acid ABC transporter permease n=1 Tax=Evansella alkalicola TaxID=745819 RepID=A0ABS6JW48_9BACI|nr:amino acid ABC transporter permease [Litchfieldia alkalitelluris]MBU9721467.1 amino acid ABC transporter permease [Bacillus alkalicola]
MTDTFEVMRDAMPVLMKGLQMTVLITIISLLIALVIGLVFGLFSISKNKVLRAISTVYVNIIRGTPILVQILYIYIGIPAVTDLRFSAFAAGVIVISINAGAYLVEIFRAGINSIDKGQMEAGRTLGFSYGETMRIIILPQAIKRMLPAFVNQFIVSIKDTSLLSVIGIGELLMSGQSIYSANFKAFEILTLVGILYFIIIYTLTLFSRWLERRMDVS